jgi:hypothetical protein
MVALPAFWKPLLLKDARKSTSGKLPTSSPGDGGNNGELIAVRYLCILSIQITDILIALVDVDEGAKFAIARIEVLLEVWMLGGEVPEGLAGGSAPDLDLGAARRVLSQGCWDPDLRHI